MFVNGVGIGCDRQRPKSYDRQEVVVAPGNDANVTGPSGKSVVQPPLPPKVGSEAWKKRALRGVEEPAPDLSFLDDQGNWHTPFDQPGMTKPYDLRGWHAAPVPSADAPAK